MSNARLLPGVKRSSCVILITMQKVSRILLQRISIAYRANNLYAYIPFVCLTKVMFY